MARLVVTSKVCKCFCCARLEYHVTHYSCPRNPKFNPKKLPTYFAEKCTLFIHGEPKVGAQRIFFSNYFDVEVGESYHSVHVTAKNGYMLQVDPQSNPQKITIYALEKPS